MSREIKRVPLDFDWPIDKDWSGYVRPANMYPGICPECEGEGTSDHFAHLYSIWNGTSAFRPSDNGSTPWLPTDEPVVTRAQRNIDGAPDFYRKGALALANEARRLADLFNTRWMHHLNQDDVDALIAADRLHGFTRVPLNDKQRADANCGFLPYNNGYVPTVDEVNHASVANFGFPSGDGGVVVQARCKREGFPSVCDKCGGTGLKETYPGHNAECEAWKKTDPPVGDGYQVWQTVSEGSPVSPVFASPGEVIDWLIGAGWSRSWAEELVNEGWIVDGVASFRPPSYPGENGVSW